MKLLFDHNLPPLLVSRLADLFPQSQHVFVLGLDRATDFEIREYARETDYFIVTKDADFSDLWCCWVSRQRSFGSVEETVQQKPLRKFCGGIKTTLRR
jgi:predicted nuclease of predicted toxin-antitoxin system